MFGVFFKNVVVQGDRLGAASRQRVDCVGLIHQQVDVKSRLGGLRKKRLDELERGGRLFVIATQVDARDPVGRFDRLFAASGEHFGERAAGLGVVAVQVQALSGR